MTQFPTEFPQGSLTAIVNFISGQARDVAILCHALWDIAGFALNKFVGPGIYSLVGAVADDPTVQMITGMMAGFKLPDWVIPLVTEILALILKLKG